MRHPANALHIKQSTVLPVTLQILMIHHQV
jgi:hypothetical protein